MSCQEAQNFFDWFKRGGGTVDEEAMGIFDFPLAEGGRGAVALKDIPEDHVLFAIPRSLTLSTRTSKLPELFGIEQWKQLNLHRGWAGLILCMMWEAAQGKDSPWAGYLEILPTKFDTPMFWSTEELSELTGTSIIGKLGKDNAERNYETKVKPAIKAVPGLFTQSKENYSLERYHITGSRILSRSFTVEKWEGDHEGNEEPEHSEDENESSNANDATPVAEQNEADGMDVDEGLSKGDYIEEDDGDEDEGDDESDDIAMVPMADMLNARFGTENAKLFHEKDELKMITTKSIKCGEQIWNTYGDLPNAELLRRYGHVDVLPLTDGRLGNPGDVAEVGADAVVEVIREGHPQISEETLEERIDWWLEEGGDDVFELELDLELPLAALSLIKLLRLSEAEWTKARDKGKLPKPKAEREVLQLLGKALEKRCSQYPTTIQEDEARLQAELSTNARNAIIVRLGEKHILQAFVNKVNDALKTQGRAPKRKAKDQDDDTKKRPKR